MEHFAYNTNGLGASYSFNLALYAGLALGKAQHFLPESIHRPLPFTPVGDRFLMHDINALIEPRRRP